MKYIFIICPFTSLIFCQIIKTIYETIKYKKFDIKRVIGSGSMPSAHACFISSLTLLIGYKEGFDTSTFALALVVMLITCYDAMSVRYESGEHARILNDKFGLNLKDKIGHKFLEVIVGILVGVMTSTIFYLFLI